MKLRFSLFLLLLAIVAVWAVPTPAQGQFAGVTLNVLTFTGPQIAEPLQRRAPDFEALTGAKVNVVTVPFSDLFQKILTDAATGTNSFDAWVFAPQWLADFVPAGIMEDLTDRVASDPELQWDDIGPFFRDFSATFGGKIRTIPLDGDFHIVYFRTDLLAQEGLNPPETWDDYLNIAKTFNGKDLNGDGKPDFGSCISKKRNAQAFWFIWSFAGAFLQTQGTDQGAFFDRLNMKPLTNNEAFAEALKLYKETTKFGPPDELNLDVGDTRGLFTSGRCALSIDWGDIGPLAIDPDTSVVQNKVGAAILPGTRRVLDRNTGKLVDCNADTCPFAVNGVNHAPYAAFGGWSGGINVNADAGVKDAAFAFFSFMSQPKQSNEDVTIGRTGFNPYRTSQFENLDLWLKAGFSQKAATDYLKAIKDSLSSPNMILDLRIPKNQRYQQVVLDQAIAQYLANEITLDETMAQITNGWEEITNEEGRSAQLEAYLSSLSVKR